MPPPLLPLYPPLQLAYHAKHSLFCRRVLHTCCSTGCCAGCIAESTSGPGAVHSTTTAGAISYAGSSAAAASITTTNTVINATTLINSGNMCFVNSVLQIMVYCPPFHRLFAEFGKVLEAGWVGVSVGAG